jgi:hypothetical protein
MLLATTNVETEKAAKNKIDFFIIKSPGWFVITFEH